MTTVLGEGSSSFPFRPRSRARRISKTMRTIWWNMRAERFFPGLLRAREKPSIKTSRSPFRNVWLMPFTDTGRTTTGSQAFSRNAVRLIHHTRKSRVSFTRITGPIAREQANGREARRTFIQPLKLKAMNGRKRKPEW